MNFLLEQVTYLKEEDISPTVNANKYPSNPILEDLIEKATYYKENDILDADLSTIKRIYRFKDTDPNLYIVYLSSRKSVSTEEHQFYSSLIKKLVKEDKNKINAIIEVLKETKLNE